jgi:hypothetical protein
MAHAWSSLLLPMDIAINWMIETPMKDLCGSLKLETDGVFSLGDIK